MKNRVLGIAVAAASLIGFGGAAGLAVDSMAKQGPAPISRSPVVGEKIRKRSRNNVGGGVQRTGYIKRPVLSAAQIQRNAKKAKNIRRHKRAIKRSGRR